jgi:hypothetical protein
MADAVPIPSIWSADAVAALPIRRADAATVTLLPHIHARPAGICGIIAILLTSAIGTPPQELEET